jgi:chromosomal replication initiation ATPase DnaA
MKLSDKENIFTAIETVTGIDRSEFCSLRRTHSDLRCIICEYLHNQCGWNLREIGEVINRNHSTIINSLTNYKNWIEFDKPFQELVNEVNLLL